MTEQQQLMAMLDRAKIGYGVRIDHNPPGEAVQVETGEDGDSVWFVAEFQFDGAGRLVATSCYPGEEA